MSLCSTLRPAMGYPLTLVLLPLANEAMLILRFVNKYSNGGSCPENTVTSCKICLDTFPSVVTASF